MTLGRVSTVGAETVTGRPSFILRFQLPRPVRPAVGCLRAKLRLVEVRAGGETEEAASDSPQALRHFPRVSTASSWVTSENDVPSARSAQNSSG